MVAASGHLPHGYGYGIVEPSVDTRPLVALDVDGVLALEPDIAVTASVVSVSAWGKWTREIAVPEGAAAKLSEIAARCEVAWATAWSYNAHEALKEALDLPEQPWTFLPVQFDAVQSIADYAAGRPWVWITEEKAEAPTLANGTVVSVNPRLGLDEVDVPHLFRALGID